MHTDKQIDWTATFKLATSLETGSFTAVQDDKDDILDIYDWEDA